MADTRRSSQYSVVLTGHMNAPIHHPYWYRHEGLITEAEEQEAVKSDKLILLPQLSQFFAGSIEVLCQEGRWEIKTSDSSSADRIRQIAVRLFDGVLPHTPVSA